MRFLAALWAWWKPKAHAFGAFQTRLILTVFYYIVFLPVAIAAGRPWRRPRPTDEGTSWTPRTTRDRSIDDLRRQHS
ncbi:MAG: hypothetical protein IPO76_07305 [Elusimicrobia bacterium]|jgi:hypothetical protein|nr:hypothetical protein [Elusimicrobiota bacterium]MBK7545268.1 hypothetical protein [Elusimicrobiota bacterium]MBK7575718.1 hypothetical protein [Elusimicrobiota bacterium]MBK8126930.1 hypothetical protein [Elusimicrobiota bacterium]MBK8423750.1 hypothetical protein [Elusimicrobiota bacterium]